MPQPNILASLARRGMLLRGESIVASMGLAAAAVLLGAMAGAAWWTLGSHQRSLQEVHAQQGRNVGSLLAQTSEVMLTSGDLTAVRRLMSDAARENGLERCRIVLGERQVIADADISKITVERLPERWTAGPVEPSTDGPADTLTMVYPLKVADGGPARLEISFPAEPSTVASYWEAQAGLGLIGAVSLIGLLIVYRHLRSRLRPICDIAEALNARAGGEENAQALMVRHPGAAESEAWNALLSEIDALRKEQLADRVQEKLGSRRGDNDLQGVCDAMWQGLILIDENLKVNYANGAAAVMLRQDRETMIDKTLADCLEAEEVLTCVQSVISGALRRRSSFEIRQQGEDGHGVLRFGVRPVRRGDSASAMVIIEDITQQRMAEEARNTFVAHATHELRMPLTNIRLYAESALEEGEEDHQVRARCLNVINQESRRLERIVGDMLSVAEIEAGTLKLRVGDVRLDALFEELKSDYVAQAEEKEIKLEFNLPPKLPVIQGDRDKIAMALHNLIGNALKYTPAKGGVTVTVEPRENRVEVEVSDTGIGIKAEDQKRIFERFYRADDARLGDIEGSGLGLALAREVIRLHRGDITVQSDLNQGSQFTLTLPTLSEAA